MGVTYPFQYDTLAKNEKANYKTLKKRDDHGKNNY